MSLNKSARVKYPAMSPIHLTPLHLGFCPLIVTTFACIVVCAPNASAQSAAQPSPRNETAAPNQPAQNDDEDPAPIVIRPAPDSLSWHLILAPKVSYLAPLGNAEERFSHQKYVTPGPNFGLDVALGVSRYVALHARFDYALWPAADSCAQRDSCKATSMAFGLGAEYHVVDGAAIDPWVRVGVGYRLTDYKLTISGHDSSRKYRGFDWLHLALGADWFVTRKFGFGPYMHLDLGTYNQRPSSPPPPATEPVATSVHTLLSVGLRLAISPMR